MNDFAALNRRVMMRRYNLERRKKHLRRLYYHALDAAGFVCWGIVGIIATACTIFLVAHR